MTDLFGLPPGASFSGDHDSLVINQAA